MVVDGDSKDCRCEIHCLKEFPYFLNVEAEESKTVAYKEMQKHSSLTPLTEKKRNKTHTDSSASRNHTAGPKWRFLYGDSECLEPRCECSHLTVGTKLQIDRS
ncbi:hypothetical protein MTR_3g055390 [Medicago truncatula]|uniref:Uncharacterized protein n=1 Tax=Medicago truncatula TaxID=3880 RepID=G7J051_MEDTR|nr:hypothetical protein MTR_3g055390 [Medicago truncatula]